MLRLLPQLRSLTQHPENLRQLPTMLARIGVRLVLVEALQKTRLDGAAFWLDKSPVIALSLRFDRIDSFWFTLTHEVIHVKNRDSAIDSDLVTDGGGGEDEESKEAKVNAEAAELLVPQDKLRSFIVRVRPLYSKKRIIQFAQANGVHPGVVVGQLHRRREFDWKFHRESLVKVRDHIAGIAMTDGWGHTPGSF